MLSVLAPPPDPSGYPNVRITNGLVEARLYLPDAQRGSYRAGRFDWSGIIYSLRFQGHEYFGQWYPRHDPAVHDAITGPVEEFSVQGAPGVKLGVGLVVANRIVDHGKWSIHASARKVVFVHVLSDGSGFAYEYRKVVRLKRNRPELVIEHTLRNTGRKLIDAEQYNHNFFVIDRQASGPGILLEFPFPPRPVRDLRGLLAVSGKQLSYLHEFEEGQDVYTELVGFGASAKDYDFRLENRNVGAGVRITCDQPLSKLAFWTRRTTVCPEPFVAINVPPRGQKHWKITYEFYSARGKATEGSLECGHSSAP